MALVPATVIFYSAVDVGMVATQVSELGRITIDPDACGGRPCLRGLRIRVKDVLDLLAAGAAREEMHRGLDWRGGQLPGTCRREELKHRDTADLQHL